MQLYFGDLIPYSEELLRGLGISVAITAAAVVLGGLVGIIVYAGRASHLRAPRLLASSYIEVVRNTPLLLQLYLVYFALPSLGIDLDPITAGIVALSVNNSAYVAEIYRAGFEAIPKGLTEAASALGLSGRTTFVHVRLVPALRTVLPALTNQVILLFLASSVASIIAVPELMHVMMGITTTTFRTIETFVVGGILYFAVAFVLALTSRVIETRMIRWRAV
ncbi:amino acid ABC transporter permease [Rhodococcus rhodochrous]|uniref:Polar amino acid ABC transporter permease n=1 Tax=Rhodococcus rhodochrous KG-21 TaxID=1441923 RepID=A0A0M8PLJ8_RHORH|nr:amino acid ABC transporter permease [Rhodococcus rhodochrous]KOS54659.1 polar amino acid ABC transporter permease [Rhodococcus rhodochrous KG-21]